MQLYGYSTELFKNVFTDYDEFKLVYSDSVFFNDSQGNWIGPSEQTFKIIYNNFSASHIALTKEDFYGKFENILFEHFEKFEYDIALKKSIRSTSDEQWTSDGDVIQNEAAAPNTTGTNDATTLDSLDKQVKVKTQSSYSGVLSKKFANNKSYYVQSFLDKFKWLFIRILDPQTTPVWLSNEEGNLI